MKKKRFVFAEIGIGAVLFALTCFLFYMQATGRYYSDLTDHIESALSGDGYSLVALAINGISRICEVRIGTAVFEAVLIVLTWLLGQRYIRKAGLWEKGGRVGAMLIALALLFLGTPLFPTGGIPKLETAGMTYYMSAYATQPWHNSTYICMRLIALLYLCVLARVLPRYTETFTLRDWLALSLVLAVSAAAKPNFLLCVCFALLVILLADFVRCRRSLRSLSRVFMMGTTVFLSLLVLYLQTKILYGGEPTGDAEPSRIVFVLKSSFYGTDLPGFCGFVIKMLRAWLFPAAVLLYNRKSLSKTDVFLFLCVLFSVLIGAHLQETGVRADHGNFFWGVNNGAYLLYLQTVPRFLRNLTCPETGAGKGRRVYYCYIVLGSFLLVGALLSGGMYFVRLLSGMLYDV